MNPEASTTGIAFWAPPRTLEDVLQREGTVTAASVVVGVLNQESERCQFFISAYYERRTGEWWLVSANPGRSEMYRDEYFFF